MYSWFTKFLWFQFVKTLWCYIKLIFLCCLGNPDTKSNLYPSQNSSDTSPPQAIPFSPDLFTCPDGLTHPKNESVDIRITGQTSEKIRIIAQPKAFYRERYCSETDPTKNRAQRFIRAEEDNGKHEYPTIEVWSYNYYHYFLI